MTEVTAYELPTRKADTFWGTPGRFASKTKEDRRETKAFKLILSHLLEIDSIPLIL